MPRECSFEGCDRTHMAKGWCPGHYVQFRKDGFVKPIRPRTTVPDWDGKQGQLVPTHLLTAPATSMTCHGRVKRLWGSASQFVCVSCESPAQDWAYDGTDPSEMYLPATIGRHYQRCSQWPEFYMPMCKRCHKGRDAADMAQELLEYRRWKSRNPGKTLEDVA